MLNTEISASKLAVINDIKQKIHNLRNRFPIGIASIDYANDEKLRNLIILQGRFLRHLDSKR
jgi:hypothetical protein